MQQFVLARTSCVPRTVRLEGSKLVNLAGPDGIYAYGFVSEGIIEKIIDALNYADNITSSQIKDGEAPHYDVDISVQSAAEVREMLHRGELSVLLFENKPIGYIKTKDVQTTRLLEVLNVQNIKESK